MDKRLLTEEEKIKAILKEIEPEGFDWTDITDTEMTKFKAIATLTRVDTAREIKKDIDDIIQGRDSLPYVWVSDLQSIMSRYGV